MVIRFLFSFLIEAPFGLWRKTFAETPIRFSPSSAKAEAPNGPSLLFFVELLKRPRLVSAAVCMKAGAPTGVMVSIAL